MTDETQKDTGDGPHASTVKKELESTETCDGPHASTVNENALTDTGDGPHASTVSENASTDTGDGPHASTVNENAPNSEGTDRNRTFRLRIRPISTMLANVGERNSRGRKREADKERQKQKRLKEVYRVTENTKKREKYHRSVAERRIIVGIMTGNVEVKNWRTRKNEAAKERMKQKRQSKEFREAENAKKRERYYRAQAERREIRTTLANVKVPNRVRGKREADKERLKQKRRSEEFRGAENAKKRERYYRAQAERKEMSGDQSSSNCSAVSSLSQSDDSVSSDAHDENMASERRWTDNRKCVTKENLREAAQDTESRRRQTIDQCGEACVPTQQIGNDPAERRSFLGSTDTDIITHINTEELIIDDEAENACDGVDSDRVEASGVGGNNQGDVLGAKRQGKSSKKQMEYMQCLHLQSKEDEASGNKSQNTTSRKIGQRRYDNKDPSYGASKNQKRNTELRRLRRQDPNYRKAEQIRERERKRRLRDDPEYRKEEMLQCKERHRLRRQDPEYRKAELAKMREWRRVRRQDPDYRMEERARGREYQQRRRQDPEVRKEESERKKQWFARKCEDPEFRMAAQAKNTENRRRLRENPEYRKAEQAKNTEAHRLKSQDPERRKVIQMRKREWYKQKRQDPEFQKAYRKRIEKRRLKRQDPDYRMAEQLRFKEWYERKRKEPAFRRAERERKRKWYLRKRQDPDFLELQRMRSREWYKVYGHDPKYRYEKLVRNRRYRLHRELLAEKRRQLQLMQILRCLSPAKRAVRQATYFLQRGLRLRHYEETISRVAKMSSETTKDHSVVGGVSDAPRRKKQTSRSGAKRTCKGSAPQDEEAHRRRLEVNRQRLRELRQNKEYKEAENAKKREAYRLKVAKTLGAKLQKSNDPASSEVLNKCITKSD